MKKKIAIALVAGVILSSAGGGYAYSYTKIPVAYVSIDINPSVELGVNAFDKVVSVEAYNEDGKNILEGTNLVDSKIDDAVNTVISNAISDGYVNEDGSSAIEITTSTDKDDIATKLDKSLKEVANKTLDSNNVKAEVETENVAITRRNEARKLGITPGKLNLIQKLQELDPTINVEDYKTSSVKDIQKKTKELRKNNKSDKATTDETTDTDIKTDVNADVVNNENADNSSNNGNSKKEEESNGNSKKEESITLSDKEEDNTNTNEKQNNNGNLNSQNKNNSNSQNNSGTKEKNKNN